MQYKALAILAAATALTMVAAMSINWFGWLAWTAAIALATMFGAFAGAMWYFGTVTNVEAVDRNADLEAPAPDERTA